MSVRLIIADDHAMFREGLKGLFRYKSDFEIVAEVSRAEEVIPTLRERRLATCCCSTCRWIAGC